MLKAFSTMNLGACDLDYLQANMNISLCLMLPDVPLLAIL